MCPIEMPAFKDAGKSDKRDKSIPLSLNWMALAGLCLGLAAGQGLMRLEGLLYVELLDLFNQGPVRTSFAMSMFWMIGVVSGPLGGIVCKTTRPRTFMMALGIFGAAAYFTAAFVSSFEAFTFAYGTLIATFIHVTTNSMVTLVGKVDVKWRTFATAVVSASGSVGAIVIAQIFSIATEEFGTRGSLIILAGVCLQVVLAGSMQTNSTTDGSNVKQSKIQTGRETLGVVSDFVSSATSKCTGPFIISVVNEEIDLHPVLKTSEESEIKSPPVEYLNKGFQSSTNFLIEQNEETFVTTQNVVDCDRQSKDRINGDFLCNQKQNAPDFLNVKEKPYGFNEVSTVHKLPESNTSSLSNFARMVKTFRVCVLPMFMNIKYIRLLVFSLLQGLGMSVSMTAAVAFVTELGAAPSQRSLFVTIANVSGAFGRFFVGYFLVGLVEKKDRILVAIIALNASASLMLFYAPFRPCVYLFFIVSGFYTDSMGTFYGYQILDSVGVGFFELGLGLVFGVYCAAILVANLLIGAVIEATGSSRLLILINALGNLVAIAILMTNEIRIPRPRIRKKTVYTVNGSVKCPRKEDEVGSYGDR